MIIDVKFQEANNRIGATFTQNESALDANFGEFQRVSNESTKQTMPTIRLVSVMDNLGSMIPDESENPLNFTVEIESGSLQIGDAIQLCAMRTYRYDTRKKQKLRRYFEYAVTEEDLKRRFVTFPLYTDPKTSMLLYRSNSLGRTGTLSAMYLRVRRPKGQLQDNESGMTVDAEFSNVITIWKTFSIVTGQINIK